MMQMKESVNMPKANISIVLFNNENEIQQRMDVLHPFFANEAISQVYIVDNNSSDKTVELVKDYAKDFSKIKVVELHENKGFGFGHNAAINQSSEDYHLSILTSRLLEVLCVVRRWMIFHNCLTF